MRLLCVEDERPLREDIAEYLRLQSHEVAEAGCGEEALEQCARTEFDLVLCDIKMPRMDGFDVLRAVRTENKTANMPFIFLSALTEDDNRLRAHHWGCDAYLTKPIDFTVLDATISSHIARKRANDYLFTGAHESLRSHVIAAIEDALREPITDVSLLMQYLREMAANLAPEKIAGHLQEMQEKINNQAVMFDTLLNTLVLQKETSPPHTGSIRAGELLETVISHCFITHAVVQVDGTGMSSARGLEIEGNIQRLRYALEGLARAAQPLSGMPILLKCERALQHCSLTVADHREILEEGDGAFFAVDERTDLANISPVTRKRLVPLLYAGQVARLHHGVLEIKLWEEHHMAARIVIAQERLGRPAI